MSYYRHPKTQGERRQASAAVEDGLHVRGKRRAINLPTNYEDLWPMARADRSWKGFRKTRYKPVDAVTR